MFPTFSRCAATILVAASCVSVEAQDAITESRRNAIVQAIEKAAPAVVSVNVVVASRAQRPMTIFDFFEPFQPPQRRLQKVDSVGSGFIIDKNGVALTNYHVVEGAAYVHSVTLPDGRELEAEIVGSDPRLDVAVLMVHGDNLPTVPLATSDDLLIGEWAIAIGNPFGGLIGDPQPSVSVGVVSAVNRRVNRAVGEGQRSYQNMIQTDAAINPGNSGGPLLNARGEVIGINTMIFSKSGSSAGIGFAIPIDRARRSKDEIARHGRRRDPWPGFRMESIERIRKDYLRQWGVAVTQGCLVLDILRSSPAYASGLRPGDVVTAINNSPVTFPEDFDYALWQLFVGDECSLTINRAGETSQIRFRIEELQQ